jgi:NAD(P)-dependent dehydrogenase (short-subunit alcohol dehydrogenase family)
VVALYFAARGADIVINHLDRSPSAEGTRQAICALGRNCAVVEADVADPASAAAIVAAADKAFGRADVLVHNASNFVTEPFGAVTPSAFDESMGVILRGPFFLTQEAGNYMLQQGWGKILAIAGNSVHETWPDHAVHSLAKNALVRMMEIFAIGLSPVVQCYTVAPHRIMPSSAGQDGAVSSRRGEDMAEPGQLVQLTPSTVVRQPAPEDVARALLMLTLCPPSVTGALVTVDGGRALL